MDIAVMVAGVLSRIPIIRIVGAILSIVLFVFMIMGIIYAAKEEDKELPLIGAIKILN